MDLSIIIPSLNEGHHLNTLIKKIYAILEPFSIQYETWIIDDSTDNTPQLIQKIKQDHSNVHCIHRDYIAGQNSAILEGFRHSSGECIIVLNGTLQHPPELFIDIYHALITDTDIIIPSRFIKKQMSQKFTWVDKFNYWLNQRTRKKYIPNLNFIQDCTNNYFGLKRTVIKDVEFNLTHRYLLTEILSKGNFKNIREVPYPISTLQKHYLQQPRLKQQFKQQWSNVKQIKKLILS